MTIKEFCMITKRAIKCTFGMHEPSTLVTVRINGIDYQVCRWCRATLKPTKTFQHKL